MFQRKKNKQKSIMYIEVAVVTKRLLVMLFGAIAVGKARQQKTYWTIAKICSRFQVKFPNRVCIENKL